MVIMGSVRWEVNTGASCLLVYLGTSVNCFINDLLQKSHAYHKKILVCSLLQLFAEIWFKKYKSIFVYQGVSVLINCYLLNIYGINKYILPEKCSNGE